jgi:tetratricopeptide (TPR) repeat protein
MNPRLRIILATALLVVMAATVHWPATRGEYIWDDNFYVEDNLPLRALDGLASIWFDVGATPQYYPMVFTTFWVEYRIWQLDPTGYHVVNILLHALGVVLLWRVLKFLGVPGAWVAAAVFAVHPVHVESVAWITERKNVLSGVFYLGAALAYLRFALAGSEGPRQRGRPWLYPVSLLLYLCALASKSVTCSLPAAMLLVLWWKRGRIGWRDVLPLLPFFVVGVASGLLTAWMEVSLLGAKGAEWDHSAIERGLIAGRALWFYAGKIAWPTTLAFIYPRWTIDASVWWQYLFPVAAAAVVVTLWLARSRIGRGPLVAVLFFAGTLVPALGFFNVYPHIYSFVADHFQYLASIGIIALGVGAGFTAAGRFGRRGSRVAAVASAVILAVLGALSWCQARVYADREALWRDTIAKNPGAWIAYNNLGTTIQAEGLVEEAIGHYQEALRLAPQYGQAYVNLGNALQMVGRIEESVEYCLEALRIDPNDHRALNNLGNALLMRGNVDEAVMHLRRAVELRPGFALAHNNLGLCLLARGDLDQALHHLRHAAELKPDDARIQAALGVGLQQAGALARAISHLRRAAELRPDNADMHHALGVALQQSGDLPAAMEEFHRALELVPEHAGACAGLGAALAAQDRYDDAIFYFRESLRVRSNNAEAHHALGTLLIMTEKLETGLTHLREAARLNPSWPVALNDAAWVMATFEAVRNPDEAVRLAERASSLTSPPDAQMLDTLAAAYASAGRFDQAVAAAQAAVQLAATGRDLQLEQAIAARLALYRQGQPYVDVPAP